MPGCHFLTSGSTSGTSQMLIQCADEVASGSRPCDDTVFQTRHLLQMVAHFSAMLLCSGHTHCTMKLGRNLGQLPGVKPCLRPLALGTGACLRCHFLPGSCWPPHLPHHLAPRNLHILPIGILALAVQLLQPFHLAAT